MTRPRLRSALPLPRYTRPRRLARGNIGYFFLVPKWARLKGCPIQSQPLGDNYEEAVQRAERILLPAFDSWLRGGDDAKPGVGVVIGSVDWLFNEFRVTWTKATAKRTRALSPGQCRVHETGIKMITEYLLKDGRHVGSLNVRKIDAAFGE